MYSEDRTKTKIIKAEYRNMLSVKDVKIKKFKKRISESKKRFFCKNNLLICDDMSYNLDNKGKQI